MHPHTRKRKSPIPKTGKVRAPRVPWPVASKKQIARTQKASQQPFNPLKAGQHSDFMELLHFRLCNREVLIP